MVRCGFKMPAMKQIGCDNIQTSLRLRGVGYRRSSCKPCNINPNYNRHGFRHILVALSPGSLRPMPLSVCLGFPEGFLVSCYKIGMILVESCKPDWGYVVERLIEDFSRQLDDDASFLVEKIE